MLKATLVLITLLSIAWTPAIGWAAPKKSEKKADAPAAEGATIDPGSEKVNVDTIKEKYWARGDETELGVVQNRLYSKAHRFEAQLFTGIVASDPFLSIKNYGLALGYHFNEYIGVSAIGWRNMVGPSSALETFRAARGADSNTNEPRSFLGGEVTGSFLYGKLSLVGKAIIYYDMHVSAGAGLTFTESGNNFTPMIGIGQQVYLNKNFSLRIDYRLQRYVETIREKTITATLLQPVGQRVNFGNVITLGITYFFGFGK